MNKLLAIATAAYMITTPMVAAKDLALSYFMGPKHPMNEAVFTPFAEKLAELSGGKLTVTQFPGGALNSSPPKQYSILLDGIADIAFHLPGYTAQLFPVTTAVTTPDICSDAVECTEALWRAHEVIEKEFDAKILALWANEPPIIFTKNQPVRELKDMSGLIVRVTSAQDSPFIEALGASAVSQPASEMNQNLANGVIDAISVDPSASLSFKLDEPANYITTNVPGSGSAFVLLMNRGVYDSMSDEEKGWIDAASGKWLSLSGGEKYRAMGRKGIEDAKKNGVEIITLTDEERARWDAAIQPAMETWLQGDVGQGLTGADVMRLMKGE